MARQLQAVGLAGLIDMLQLETHLTLIQQKSSLCVNCRAMLVRHWRKVLKKVTVQ